MLVMLSGVVMAQVESGKVYRIVSGKYGTVITSSLAEHTLSCVEEGGSTDYQQMWQFTQENNGKFSIKNVFTGRYIQHQEYTNSAFKTGSSKVEFAIKENSELKGYYNIDATSKAAGWGLHCAQNAAVVPWSYGPDKDGLSGSEWTFKEVSITELEIEEAQQEYAGYNEILRNKESIINKVNGLFEDNAGTVLKSEYRGMGNQELQELLDSYGVPVELQQAIIKIKNDSWTTCERPLLGEKNFRVHEYRPYSDTERWKDILYLRPFNRINNPTGICSNSDKGFLYVFVENIPDGAYVDLAEMPGTGYWGTDTRLTKGLNIVPSVKKNGVLYVRYVVDTHTNYNNSNGKKIADYPNVKVHIEGGYVNGFWSKERGHTNADWVYMRDNMFQNPEAVQAKGDMSLLNFRKAEFLADHKWHGYKYNDDGTKVQGCPENIEGVMKLWDFWNERQRFYMGLDKYADRFNNMQLAMSDDGGFMDAGAYRTHYNNNTLNTIVNYERLINDAGSSWGPNHEIGHTNQYAFQIVGTSEVSNNALTNFAIFDQGTHTSRGNNMENQILDFEKGVPYVVRGEKDYGSKLFSMTRMYFQLFLYFHAAGNMPDFYPRLFEELRKDKLIGWNTRAQDELDPVTGYYKGSINALHDQLKFAEKCMEIAQMDLLDFFEAWGFYIPMKNAYVGDYGHHYVYLTQEDIDAWKAKIRAKGYTKKGGQIMFLEDRVRAPKAKASPFCDVSKQQYRKNYAPWEGERIGEVGEFGHWEDLLETPVKAEGYYYTIVKDKVLIKLTEGARGAFGFKLLDAEGNLLSFTNNREMNIPAGVDRSGLRVVAAQADGEDADVKPASEGPAEMQKDALDASLASAKRYLDRKIVKGMETQIGRYYPEALVTLQEIYDAAKADTNGAVNSFADWSAMLDDEVARVSKNRDAMINLKEGMKVAFMSTTKRKGVLVSTGDGVKSNTGARYDITNAWTIEYTGIPNVYYLRDVNGRYMRDLSVGEMVDANERNTARAAKFTFGYDEQGYVIFSSYETGESFGVEYAEGTGKEEAIIKMNSSDVRARWKGVYFEDNSADFYKNELETLLVEAGLLTTEIINFANIGTMNIFNDNINVLDRNLETAAMELYNLYKEASENIGNAENHREYVIGLREKISEVEGKYIVVGPLVTKSEEIMWYRLRNKETGMYLSVDGETCVTVDPENVDDNALWTFTSTGVAGKYNVYSCGADGYMYYDEEYGDIYAGAAERLPVGIAYDKNGQGVVLSIDAMLYGEYTEGANVLDDGMFVYLQAGAGTCWELEFAKIEVDEILAGDIVTAIEGVLEEGNYDEDFYDLTGRKVTNPVRGIYIQNGKKVLFK